MKVLVCDNKVFVYNGDLLNETLEIETEKGIEVYVLGNSIIFKDSYFVRLTNWLTGKKMPSVGMNISNLAELRQKYELSGGNNASI